MEISLTEPSIVWVFFVCIVALTAGATFLIVSWKARSKKADCLKDENANLKAENASLMVKNDALQEESVRQIEINDALISAKHTLTQQLLIERVSGQAQIRVALCEVKAEAFTSARVERELHWQELPGKWFARNYVFAYRETLWILGNAKPELTIAKFESRMPPEAVVAILGAGVKLIQLTAGGRDTAT